MAELGGVDAARGVLDMQSGITLDAAAAARITAHWRADAKLLQETITTFGEEAFFDTNARQFARLTCAHD